MSEFANDPGRSFYRTENIPQSPPPVSTVGVLGWMRQNLFSSPVNTALTLLTLYLLYSVVPPLFEWAFIDSLSQGESNKDCRGIEGACWVLVPKRFGQYIYGFYPEPERWRVNLTFILFCLNLFPVLSDRVPGRTFAALFLVFGFPVIAFVLLHGAFGLEVVPTNKWGGLTLTLVFASVAILFSLPIGILLALGRRSEMPVVRTICIAFIELWRAVPLITVLFMASFVLPLFTPEGGNANELLRALIGFTMFSSAYMAEVVRGGLQPAQGPDRGGPGAGAQLLEIDATHHPAPGAQDRDPGHRQHLHRPFQGYGAGLDHRAVRPAARGRSAVTDPKWLGLEHESYIFAAVIYFIFCFSMSRYSLWLERKLDTGPQNLREENAPMSEPIIRIEGMNKWFGQFHVLRDIDLTVNRGERIVICGPSGSGKSTLIRCINRLEEHQKGAIVVEGIELTGD